MTTLQEWKKAKREEFVDAYVKSEQEIDDPRDHIKLLQTFLDTSFDELVALVEVEVGHFNDGCGCCGYERVKDVLARLRGETNE